MKALILFIFITSSSFYVSGQEKMRVNMDEGGTTEYDDCDKKISSLRKLPAFIRVNIDSLLKKTLGEFAAGVTFSHGQIINIEKLFSKDDGQPSDYEWVIPKYDLKFVLKDTSIGIKSYRLQINLDQYGQVLKMNWPRRNYKSKAKFTDRAKVKALALSKATSLNFNQKDYEVEFYYDDKKEAFYWEFLFPNSPVNEDDKRYDCIAINWADLNDFKISQVSKTRVY